MTVNGVMSLILRYFTEFGSFRSSLRKSFFNWPSTASLPRNVIKYTNYARRTRCILAFAIAEL